MNSLLREPVTMGAGRLGSGPTGSTSNSGSAHIIARVDRIAAATWRSPASVLPADASACRTTSRGSNGAPFSASCRRHRMCLRSEFASRPFANPSAISP